MAKKSQKYVIAGDELTLEGGTVIFNVNDVPEELHHDLKMHGFKQKLVDQCSGLKKALGRELETADYEEAMTKVLEHLIAGQWKQVRIGGTKRTALQVGIDKLGALVETGSMTQKEADKNIKTLELIYAV